MSEDVLASRNLLLQKRCFIPDQALTILGAGEVFRAKIEPCLNKLGVSHYNIYEPKVMGNSPLGDFQLQGPVFVLSPNVFHLSQTEYALRKGHPCYVEKPIVISTAELDQLLELVKNIAMPLYCGDYYFFKALPLLLRYGHFLQYGELVKQSGDYDHCGSAVSAVEAVLLEGGGEPSGSIAHRAWLGDVRAGGGMLLDLMIHLTNILNMLGLRLETVSHAALKRFDTQSWRYEPIDGGSIAEDYAEASGVLAGNIPVTLRAGKYSAAHERYIRLHHQDGCITTLYFTEKNFVQTVDRRTKILWQSELLIDPYLVAMHDALAFFHDSSMKKDIGMARFLEEQALSIRQVDLMKKIALECAEPASMSNCHA